MTPSPLEFLNGGGEMGARMRLLNWAATPLGPAHQWPQSLKTIVRVMLDSRFAMWMMWGEAGTFFCNDAYLPTVGVKREWVLGARAEKVWEEIWPDIGPRIAHVFRTGEATYDEGLLLFLRRSGYDEETFHTFSYSPVYDDQSSIAGMLCVVAEETTRVIGERRMSTLRELAAVPTSDVLRVEVAGRRLLGTLATNRLDVPFAALYLHDPRTNTARLVECGEYRTSGRLAPRQAGDADALPIEHVMRGGKGCLVSGLKARGAVIAGPWAEQIDQAMILPLGKVGQSTPLGALVLGVSTRRQLDAAYQSFLELVAGQVESGLIDTNSRLETMQRAEALAELDRAKNVFFGNVSHEFRTPLTLMLGPVDDLLARNTLPGDVLHSLQLVQRNGQRLRKLVNSLLDFSRIEAGRVDAQFQPTDLASLTADLAAVFRSAIEQAGLRLIVRCEPLAEPVYVDRDMWEKVVLNLLSNAFKYTLQGEIEVALAVQGQAAHLGVRDTGVGIAENELPFIFDRFHRVIGTAARSQEGTGIGLALVQELTKLHRGSVSVVSKIGTGTCFTVSIPLGKAHLSDDRILTTATPISISSDSSSFVDDALRSGSSALPNAANARIRDFGSTRRERILIVDDNGDMRDYLARMLHPYWDVTTAANGRIALDCIQHAVPDLVITDMNMPHMDGRALIQHIRIAQASHALPVIVLSAQAGDEQRIAGLNQGADDYLVKPFSTRELLARVEVQLLRARLRSADAAQGEGVRLSSSLIA